MRWVRCASDSSERLDHLVVHVGQLPQILGLAGVIRLVKVEKEEQLSQRGAFSHKAIDCLTKSLLAQRG